MIKMSEFVLRARLRREVVEAWIGEGWLRPQQTEGGLAFSEMDLARAELIRDLREDLGVNEEGVAIILDLVDQMYGLRRMLRELCEAIGAQPEELQQKMAVEILSRRPIHLGGPADQ
jgi:chaperone modulatory protein CbpM